MALEAWRKLTIEVIFKKGDASRPENYRMSKTKCLSFYGWEVKTCHGNHNNKQTNALEDQKKRWEDDAKKESITHHQAKLPNTY